jgi:hypothetical protein
VLTTTLNTPQYLQVRTVPEDLIGQRFEIGPRFNLARENGSRRKLDASQEKSQKEKETLTVSKR